MNHLKRIMQLGLSALSSGGALVQGFKTIKYLFFSRPTNVYVWFKINIKEVKSENP